METPSIQQKKHINRTESIALGARPWHRECDICGRIPFGDEAIYARCEQGRPAVAMCGRCMPTHYPDKNSTTVEEEGMNDRNDVIEWLRRTYPKTEHPDWDKLVGNRYRSPREWRMEGLRVLVKALGRIPSSLADSINKSYSEGKIDYVTDGDDLMYVEEVRGRRETSRCIGGTGSISEAISMAHSMDVEIKGLQESMARFKAIVKDEGGRRMHDGEASAMFETGDLRAKVYKRRRHSIDVDDTDALRAARIAAEDHPNVVSVRDGIRIAAGRDDELYELLSAIGRTDLVEPAVSIDFDAAAYEAMMRQGTEGTVRPAVGTTTTLCVVFDSPDVPVTTTTVTKTNG